MERSKVKTFVSWSGGKDAALSFYRAMGDFQVTCLLNMVAEDGRISRSHGIRTDVLRMQAEAMGIQIIQQESSWETYEAEFKKALSGLKGRGVEAGILETLIWMHTGNG